MRLRSLGSRAKNFATVRAFMFPGDYGHTPKTVESTQIIDTYP